MSRTLKRRIHTPRPIPPRVWRLWSGWWISVRRTDGTRSVRRGLPTREECLAQGREALRSPNVEGVWFGLMDNPPPRR